MADTVTNSYGDYTDAFGKANFTHHPYFNGYVDTNRIRSYFIEKYGMTSNDWTELFGKDNPINSDTGKGQFKAIGTLLKQNTVEADVIELITSDVAIQVMKKLENAMQISNSVFHRYSDMIDEEIASKKLECLHILNIPQLESHSKVNLFNEYILNKIVGTRVLRRYIIIEDDGSQWAAFAEINVFNHNGFKINISADKITTCSVYNSTLDRDKLVNGTDVTTNSNESWHSGDGGWNGRRQTLVPYCDRQKHHVIIDLGVPQDISKVEVYSRYEVNVHGAGPSADNHTLYLTDHLYWRQTTTHPFVSSNDLSEINAKFTDPNAKWITHSNRPGTGLNTRWKDHPTPPNGGESVFTYVFDGSRTTDFTNSPTKDFIVNMTGWDNTMLYLNGERVTGIPTYGYTHGSWDIPLSVMVQGQPGINRFDFVVQRVNTGTHGLLASVDYKTNATPTTLNAYRYVVVQLETTGEHSNWGELQAFDASGALLLVVSSSGSSTSPHHPINRLHDNNPSSFSHSHNHNNTTINGFAGGNWMMIDLGSAKEIATVKLFARPGEWGTDRGHSQTAIRTHPHRIYLSTSFDDNDVDHNNTLVMTSKSGLGFATTDTTKSTNDQQAIYTYDVKECMSDWKHAFSTGDDEWTMSESHRTMLGSDVIQVSSMSAKHEAVSSNRGQRKTIYEFPSSSSDLQIDLGGSPVSFTVECIRKYRYVIVHNDVVDYVNWSQIEAYDESGSRITPDSSGLSSTNSTYLSTNHTDGNYDTFSHTWNGRYTINEVQRGEWAMIDLGKLYEISRVKITSRKGYINTTRNAPHHVYLTDTFTTISSGVHKTGVNTLVLVDSQATDSISSNNNRTFDYSINGSYTRENSWEISQDTNNKVVASRDYNNPSLVSTHTPIPTETFPLSSEDLGYTGSYTLTLRDFENDGWDGILNFKVTSTDVHGYTTVRAITQGVPTVEPTNGNKRVLRMHLSGDTTPIHAHSSNGLGVSQLRLSPNDIYKNKFSRMKTILDNSDGTHTASRNYILGIYEDILTNRSMYWNLPTDKYGHVASGTIGMDIDESKIDAIHKLQNITMNTISVTYFDDDDDISMYELQPLSNGYSKFVDNKILYTNRLSDIEKGSVHPLSYFTNEESKVRNGRAMPEYANEFAVEMLQNSSLSDFEFQDNVVSNLPLSMGYAVVKNRDNQNEVLNVRLYVSYVFPNILTSGNKEIAISSGVNLLDLLDIRKFSVGITSSNFLTYLSSAMMILNSDEGETTVFEESNTRWEFGYPSEYSSLKCISSVNTYWEGKLITDCYLLGSTIDIPKRVFNMLDYINTNYSELEDGQFITIAHSDGTEKLVSLVKITTYGDGFSFQHKDQRVDNIFPINNVNSDMRVTGEMQVENYKGDMILHVDPVSDKTAVMGKFGVNQELHEITAMVDIDNLSNSNMSRFVDQFAPLILYTVSKMDQQITFNPYTGIDEQYDFTAITLPLTIFTSMAPPVQETRLERFAKIQARVELPVRIFAVTNEYRILYALDSRINDAKNYLDRLKDALEDAEDRAAEAAVLNMCIKVGVGLAGAAISTFTGGIGGVVLAHVIEEVGKAIVAEAGNVAMGAINDKIEGDEEEIQDMIDNQETHISNLNNLRAAQQAVVTQKRGDMLSQADLLDMSSIYEDLLNTQTAYLFAMRLYAILRQYISEKVNERFFTSDVTNCYRPIKASRYIYGENVDDYLSRNQNKFKYKTKDALGVVSRWWDIYEQGALFGSTPSPAMAGISVKDDIRGRIANFEAMTMIDYIDLVNEVGTPIFAPQVSVLIDMKNEVQNSNSNITALSYLELYVYNAAVTVDTVTRNVRNHEVSEVSKAMKIKDANDRAAAASIKSFAEWQEEIDVIRSVYDSSVLRCKKLAWLISTNPSGLHANTGDHHDMLGRCNGDNHDHYRGNLNHPYGGIYYELGLVDAWKKLKDVPAWVRGKAYPEQAKETKKRDDLKVQLDRLVVSQGDLRDELQEYTFAHDWNASSHNRIKNVISNIYKMYLLHENTMKEWELSYSCIIPVTTNSDNVTSALYMKIMPMLNESDYPQVAISGRMLDVNEFTRDKSYRDTLMLLMGSLSAATQLVNYGTVLVCESSSFSNLLSKRIRDENIFIDRFGYGELYLILDNLTDSKVVQHEIYSHWNDNNFTSLFYPDTNISVAHAYDLMNKEFINKYGFDPLNMRYDDNILKNTFIVPFKYDESWKIAVIRYLPIANKLHRISCVINVTDYLDQSIIAKGDSSFYGDLVVKSSSNQEMFQVDTLNNKTSNLYPFAIGTNNPRTMLDVRDTSVIDMNYFMSKVSNGLR